MLLVSRRLLTDRRCLLACFSLAIFVRFIPELLAFPRPIGFDTVDYAVSIRNGVVWPHWSTFFSTTWLFSAFAVPIYQLSQLDVFLLLKILAPVLFGVNAAGVFWFARKTLHWDTRLGLLASVFFAFQLAPLRISWDLLRNSLGMGLLLFTLPFIDSVGSRRGFVAFVMLSLLAVFAHEYAAVTLIAIVLVLAARKSLTSRERGNVSGLLVASAPALGFFLVGVFFRMFPVGYVSMTNVFGAGDASSGGLGRLFFVVNYFDVRSGVDYYPSYGYLGLNVAVLFAVLFLPHLFLVWKGFFRNEVLDTWTVLLLMGSFSCLILPFFALEYWHRWMFMLAYPFTFYAINAASKLSLKQSGAGSQSTRKLLNRKVKGFLLITALLGSIYLATPVLMSTVNVGIFSIPLVYRYVSSSPTVPYQDVSGVVQAMEWLNKTMDNGSCVILHHALLFWGELYLDKSHTIVSFENDFNAGLTVALNMGFTHTYSVWWNQDIGWYGLSVPSYFVRTEDFVRISVYEYSA